MALYRLRDLLRENAINSVNRHCSDCGKIMFYHEIPYHDNPDEVTIDRDVVRCSVDFKVRSDYSVAECREPWFILKDDDIMLPTSSSFTCQRQTYCDNCGQTPAKSIVTTPHKSTNNIARYGNEEIHINKAIAENTYKCPKCDGDVRVCKGERRDKYFRHIRSNDHHGHECNYYGRESDKHYDAKVNLRNMLEQNQVNRVVRHCAGCNVKLFSNEIQVDSEDKVRLEYKFCESNKKSADVAICHADGRTTLFEIFVTHRTSAFDRPEPWYEFSADQVELGNQTLTCERYQLCDECNIPVFGSITHNQRSAGCGKTYESIQLLSSADYLSKSYFIYVTKAHSAKDVIFSELKQQYRQLGLVPDKLSQSYLDGERSDINQRVLNFVGQRKATVVIGTVDSLIYAIHDQDKCETKSADFFENIRQTIIGGDSRINDGLLKYAGIDIVLRHTVLIVDETQDLRSNYANAVNELVKNHGVQLYMIGDKLQSVWGRDNIYTQLKDLGLGEIVSSEDVSHVRRFYNLALMKFVNSKVKFADFGLPCIESIGIPGKPLIDDDSLIDVFEINSRFGNDADIEKNIAKIIDIFRRELVREPDLKPNDFAVIFPILSNNSFASRLEESINNYWSEQFGGHMRWAHLHKSECGQPIDLTLSEFATRIMSIHASKGTGTRIVILLEISEYSLKLFSGGVRDIVYESLLHVALTRQKEALYIGIVPNDDDEIYLRFEDRITKSGLSQFVSMNVKISDIVSSFSENIDMFRNYLDSNCHMLDGLNNNTSLIEWQHHILRYNTMLFYFELLLMKKYPNRRDKERYSIMSHGITQSLKKFVNAETSILSFVEYSKALREISKLNREANESGDYDQVNNMAIPILKHKYDYIIDGIISNVQHKLGKNGGFIDKLKVINLCPLECLVIVYVTKLMKRGYDVDITIVEIYDIIDNYTVAYQNPSSKHSHKGKCRCDEMFKTDKINDKITSLYHHYSDLYKLREIVTNLSVQMDITGLRLKNTINSYYPEYSNSEIHLVSRDELLLLNEKSKKSIVFMFKPELNKLCYVETMLNAMLKKLIYDDDSEIIIITLMSDKPITVDVDLNQLGPLMAPLLYDKLMHRLKPNNELFCKLYATCPEPKRSNMMELSEQYRMPLYLAKFAEYGLMYGNISDELLPEILDRQLIELIKKVTDPLHRYTAIHGEKEG